MGIPEGTVVWICEGGPNFYWYPAVLKDDIFYDIQGYFSSDDILIGGGLREEVEYWTYPKHIVEVLSKKTKIRFWAHDEDDD